MSQSRTHSHRGTYAGHVAYRVSRRPAPGGSGLAGIRLQDLGSILGIGVFVGFGVATEVAGPGALPAIGLAALVAACNGLSTTQLARHSKTASRDDGTSAVSRSLAFAGGWMLACAKTCAAATAALGVAGYLLLALETFDVIWTIPVALSALGILSVPILGGLPRPAAVNTVVAVAVLVAVTLLALAGLHGSVTGGADLGGPLDPASWTQAGLVPLSHAAAIMLVAYAGLGEIAPDSYDTSDPRRSAIVLLIVATVVYIVAGTVGLGTVGAPALAQASDQSAAPLFAVGRAGVLPGVATAVAVGAVIAMVGMSWRLLCDLARMIHVLGPRGKLSAAFGSAVHQEPTPAPAVALPILAVAGLVLTRDVRVTWSLSAFTLLMYYALANLAAARLPAGARRLPRGFQFAVLGICLLLAFSLDSAIWQTGLGLLGLGVAWQWLTNRRGQPDLPPRSPSANPGSPMTPSDGQPPRGSRAKAGRVTGHTAKHPKAQ